MAFAVIPIYMGADTHDITNNPSVTLRNYVQLWVVIGGSHGTKSQQVSNHKSLSRKQLRQITSDEKRHAEMPDYRNQKSKHQGIHKNDRNRLPFLPGYQDNNRQSHKK